MVSLGGFGGYIVVGFDHSIQASGGYGGYDFSITGNQFSGSSEPGVVWVMPDENGNGEPDDGPWYELRSLTLYAYNNYIMKCPLPSDAHHCCREALQEQV